MALTINGSLVEAGDGGSLLRSRLCARFCTDGISAGLTGDRKWMQEYRAKVLERRQIALSRIDGIDGH